MLRDVRVQGAPPGSFLPRYCDRTFTETEVGTILGLSENPRYETRAEIACAVCAALHWVKPDGQPKVAHAAQWPGSPRPQSRGAGVNSKTCAWHPSPPGRSPV